MCINLKLFPLVVGDHHLELLFIVSNGVHYLELVFPTLDAASNTATFDSFHTFLNVEPVQL